MTVRLNGKKLKVEQNETFEKLVNQARQKCRKRGKILIDIKVDDESLSQSEWEKISQQTLDNREIDLIAKSGQALSHDLTDQALDYLEHLHSWLNQDKSLGDDMEKIEQVIESLQWLNLALQQVCPVNPRSINVAGRPLIKFLEDSQVFVRELEMATESPQENRQLVKTLIDGELPRWVEEYSIVFQEMKKKTEGDLFD